MTKTILIALFSAVFSMTAVAQNVDINVTTSPDEVEVGEVLEVSFTTENAADVFFFETEVVFDPNHFSFNSIQSGNLLELVVGDGLESGRVGASGVNTDAGSDGAGTLFTLTFNVLSGANGQETTIEFENSSLLDSNSDAITFTLPDNVTVEVGESDLPLRDVSFSVNMNVQENNGNFNPDTDIVRVAGAFNDWSTGGSGAIDLTNDGTGVYEGTITIEGDEGEENQYKFLFVSGSQVNWEANDTGPGDNGNRILELGPVGEPQILDTVFFSNDDDFDVESRLVTFQVDMSVQESLGFFDPELDDELYVLGSFNDWSSTTQLQFNEETGLWESARNIVGEGGSEIAYKYRIFAGDDRDLPDDGWEVFEGDRTFFLSEGGVDQILEPVFFSNREEAVGFANLQSPGESTIEEGMSLEVFGQIFIDLITDQLEEPSDRVQAWVGVNNQDTNPAIWDESSWVEADFNTVDGNNHEYAALIGDELAEGTYYYATRFQLADDDFLFGGFSETGGGFWDGTGNVSGVLTVESDVLIVWPGDANNDGGVTEVDVLSLGRYFGFTGPLRENGSISWSGQAAEPWEPEEATYADTNGDGVVNDADLDAIVQNFRRSTSGGTVPDGEPIGVFELPEMFPPIDGDEAFANVRLFLNEPAEVIGVSYNFRALALNDVSVGIVSAPEYGAWADPIFDDEEDLELQIEKIWTSGYWGALTRKGVEAAAPETDLFSFDVSAIFALIPEGSELHVYRMSILTSDGEITQLGPDDFDAEITQEVIVSTEEETNLPGKVELYQNYPNPFNPTTQVKFDLPETTEVRLDVYNIQGQRVMNLVADMRQAGTHTVSMDGSALASGLYLLRLQAGSVVQTRKMMLIK